MFILLGVEIQDAEIFRCSACVLFVIAIVYREVQETGAVSYTHLDVYKRQG